MTYPLAIRRTAVTLALATGSPAAAVELMQQSDFEQVPDDRSIRRWIHDPACQPAPAELTALTVGLYTRILGSVDRLLAPLEQRLRQEIDEGRSWDVLNLAKSFGLVAGLVMPAHARRIQPPAPPSQREGSLSGRWPSPALRAGTRRPVLVSRGAGVLRLATTPTDAR